MNPKIKRLFVALAVLCMAVGMFPGLLSGAMAAEAEVTDLSVSLSFKAGDTLASLQITAPQGCGYTVSLVAAYQNGPVTAPTGSIPGTTVLAAGKSYVVQLRFTLDAGRTLSSAAVVRIAGAAEAVRSGSVAGATACDCYALIQLPAGEGFTVTFDANGGSVTPASEKTDASGKLGALPTPTHENSAFQFEGWYTEKTGGSAVTLSTVFTQSVTVYARWKDTRPTQITVSKQPLGGIFKEGSIMGAVSVEAAVVPDQALSYTWHMVAPDKTDATFGGNAASVNIPTELAAGTYEVYCVLQAGQVSLKTDTVKIIVEKSAVVIQITKQPAGTIVKENRIAGTLSVEAKAIPDQAISYAWTIVDPVTGSTAFGGNTPQVAIPTDLKAGVYSVYCTLSAGGTTIKTDTVKVTVDKETNVVQITRQPQGAIVREHHIVGTISLEAQVFPDQAISYAWTIVDPVTGPAAFGENEPQAAIPADLKPNTYQVYCTVTAGGTSVKSDSVRLVVEKEPTVITVTRQPQGATVVAQAIRGGVYLEAAVSPEQELHYAWMLILPDQEERAFGTDAASVAIPSNLEAGEYQVYCVITAGETTVRSENARLVVLEEGTVITITQQPELLGDSVSLEATVTPEKALHYAWMLRHPAQGEIPFGGDSAQAQLPEGLEPETYLAYCILTAGEASLRSEEIEITVAEEASEQPTQPAQPTQPEQTQPTEAGEATQSPASQPTEPEDITPKPGKDLSWLWLLLPALGILGGAGAYLWKKGI